ncbi:reverse transcriptase domain-containing protein [Tanacetum coccineum]
MSSLKELIKQHNERFGTLIEPTRLSFGDEEVNDKGKNAEKGIENTKDEYLQKSFKEQMLDGPARDWFDRLPNSCIDNWADLREKFAKRFALRRRCFKDPTEVSKIIWKANETLLDFQERWTDEISYIQDVPEVMQISAFMSNSKCPKLARRFSDQVPKTVTEMMKRVDDLLNPKKSIEAQNSRGKNSQKWGMEHYTGEIDH